jgi:signal transduction histidine kinase
LTRVDAGVNALPEIGAGLQVALEVSPGATSAIPASAPGLLDAPPPALVLVDAAGLVLHVDPAAAALTGAPRDARGRPVEEVLRGPAAGASPLLERLRAVLAGAPGGDEVEAVVTSDGGRDARVGARVEPLHEARGARGGSERVDGAIVRLRDLDGARRVAGHRRALASAEALDAAWTPRAVADALVAAFVPDVADAALVVLRDAEEAVTAHGHADPGRAQELEALAALVPLVLPASGRGEPDERSPDDPGAARGLAEGRVLVRLGEARLVAPLTTAVLAAALPAPEVVAAVRALQVTSAIVVPVVAGGRSGVVALATCADVAPRRTLDGHDLSLARALARRAGHALERVAASRQAEQLAAWRARMLSQVRHDLINPPSAIALAAEVLISRLPAGDPGGPLRLIQRNAQQINRLIQEILDENAGG